MDDAKSQARTLLHEINRIADAFEDAWLAGGQPRIATYLPENVTGEWRSKLFITLLELDMEYSGENGRAYDFSELLAHHPEFHDQIELIRRQSSDTDEDHQNLKETLVVSRQSTRPRHGIEQLSQGRSVELKPGTRLGRYSIQSTLGAGATGTVYLACDLKLDRRVALKVRHRLNDQEQAFIRFVREGKAAASLRHPNICPVYDAGCIDDQQYIAMAYYSNGSLADRLKKESRLPVRRAVHLVALAARALAVTHRHGIVHRDLKPANILLDETDQPVITDFGLAKQILVSPDETLTQDGMVVGSPAYMSPEQFDDPRTVGPASDIYSLGVVLYRLLTGQLPFSGSLMSLAARVAFDTPSNPSDLAPEIPDTLERICLKAISREPGQRHASMDELADDLESWLQTPLAQEIDLPVSVQPEPLSDRGQFSNGWKRRVLTWGLPFVVLALTVIVVLLRKHNATMVVVVNDPTLVVEIAGETVTFTDQEQVLEVSPESEQLLRIQCGEMVFESETFALRRGAELRLEVTLVRDQLLTYRDGETWQAFPLDRVPESTTVPGDHASVPDSALSESQQHQLQELIDRGFVLRTRYHESLAPPHRSFPADAWALEAVHCRDFGAEDIRFLTNFNLQHRRLRLTSRQITESAAAVLREAQATDLFVVMVAPTSSTWAASIGALDQLHQLSITGHDLVDADLEPISRLTGLTDLALENTMIDGSGLVWIADLDSLTGLDLMSTRITDDNLRFLANLKKLRTIRIADTQITGQGLMWLTGLEVLQEVDLSETRIDDRHLKVLASLPCLRKLRLGGCEHISSIEALRGLQLTSISLAGTRVQDLEPLRDMPLSDIWLDYQSQSHRDLLKSMRGLEFINGTPTAEFLGP